MIRPHRRGMCQLAILLSIASAGCGSSCGSDNNSNKAKPTLQPNPTSNMTPTTNKSSEQQAFDAIVARVLTCKWEDKRGFLPRCRELKRFFRSDTLRNEKLLATLLDHKSERNRWVGATGLRRGRDYRVDVAMATRMVAVMETEANAPVALALADAISRIKLKKTKLVDRVKKMITDHPLAPARKRLLKHTLFYNQALLYDFVVELARKEKNLTVRTAAIASLFTGTPKGRYEDTCKFWSELLADPTPKIGALGGAYLTRYGRSLCQPHYDAVLAIIAKRAAAGTVKAEQLTDSLRNVYLQANATKQQKQRTLTIALTMLKNKKNYGPSRARALELLSRRHPNGKQLVKAHLKDKDGFVMRRAERLNKTSVKTQRRHRPRTP